MNLFRLECSHEVFLSFFLSFFRSAGCRSVSEGHDEERRKRKFFKWTRVWRHVTFVWADYWWPLSNIFITRNIKLKMILKTCFNKMPSQCFTPRPSLSHGDKHLMSDSKTINKSSDLPSLNIILLFNSKGCIWKHYSNIETMFWFWSVLRSLSRPSVCLVLFFPLECVSVWRGCMLVWTHRWLEPLWTSEVPLGSCLQNAV